MAIGFRAAAFAAGHTRMRLIGVAGLIPTFYCQRPVVQDYDSDVDLFSIFGGSNTSDLWSMDMMRRVRERGISSRQMYSTIMDSMPEGHWGELWKVVLEQRKDDLKKPWPTWMKQYWVITKTLSMNPDRNMGVDSATLGAGGIFDLSAVNNYGCWCNFDGHAGTGRGDPVDAMDALCESLQKCYRCTIMDSAAEGDTCSPWSEEYVVNADWADQSIVKQCEMGNPTDNCAFHTCCCETYFLSNIFELLFSGNQGYNPIYKHDNGFDYDGTCVGKSTPGDDDGNPGNGPIPNPGPGGGAGNGGGTGGGGDTGNLKQCCGEYPTRIPYNSVLNTCCGDGLSPQTWYVKPGQSCL